MVMAERLAIGPQDQPDDGTGAASPTPIWKSAVAALKNQPDGRRETPGVVPLPRVNISGEREIRVIVERAQSLVEERLFESALFLLDRLIDAVESNGLHQPAPGDEPRAFRNAFEAAMYARLYEPPRPVVKAPEALFGAYIIHGWVSFELGFHQDACQSFAKAMALNPISCAPVFEVGEMCKARGDWTGFLAYTRRAFELAYTGGSLARAYRNRGYFEIERANFDLAAALHWHSLTFDPDSDMAWNELAYIHERTGRPLVEPPADEIRSTLAASGIQLAACADVVEVALALARESLAAGEYETAALATSILSDVGLEPAAPIR